MVAHMVKSIDQMILIRKGKVRDVYDIGDGKHLLIIATDRVSAFDHVLPTPIPGKGIMLTKMSNYWFEKTKHIISNHCMYTNVLLCIWQTELYPDITERSVIVRKAEKLPIEAIVRGYLAGSAWKEYCATGSICGIKLPSGLREAERLPSPIFTPSTKEENGAHDENISFDKASAIVGKKLAQRIRDISLRLYTYVSKIAEACGIIIADTKFEFGIIDNKLVLIDELLTPDSSRFWPAAMYAPGKTPESFDKQFIRDYLIKIGWDRTSPAPPLPPEIVNATVQKYREALRYFNIKTEIINSSC
ncbi:MAG: phosphoribosylaminoimidazolesuccinocarboxamide synthase [Desulfobacterota bacterium]|nr:phosphoribosylaminoimidazolesuccinocarboxamide synthase [Thermodesulfobacteriota bacterium]